MKKLLLNYPVKMIYDSIAKKIKINRTAEGQQFGPVRTVKVEGRQFRPICTVTAKGEWHTWFP